MLLSNPSNVSEQASEAHVLSSPREACAFPRLRVSLVTSFPPSDGDLNEYGYHLASALRDDSRIELTILADETHEQNEAAGFGVKRCWRFNSLANPFRLLFTIWKTNPDVVWFNIGFSTFARKPLPAFLAITVPALARMSGYYTHVTLHTVFERINLADAGLRFPRLYQAAGNVATRLVLGANDVSVLLPSFRSELVRNYGSSASRVQARPHGTFESVHHQNIPSLNSRRCDKEQIILAFGYWGTYKRVDLLLDCMEEIRGKVPEAVLVVAGTNHPSAPGYLESLEKRWRGPGVRFLGYVPEEELPALFASATLLVLPYSSAAGTSGVVHQACQYGLPMVAAEVPELIEIAREEGIAINFYPQGDGKKLASELIQLLSFNELRRRLSKQNFAAAQKTPMSQVVDEYVRWFQERVQTKQR